MRNELFDFGIDRVMVGVGGVVGLIVAGALAAPQVFPQAFAQEPASHLLDRGKDLFPAPFDIGRLKKFDVTLDDNVSVQITHSQIVKKIGFGQKKIVSVITTPSGTYSSDALTSPYVKYPGITVEPQTGTEGSGSGWAYEHLVTPFGSGEWSSFSSGSFTYWTSSFTPKADART
jgi:hypothetical protein